VLWQEIILYSPQNHDLYMVLFHENMYVNNTEHLLYW